MLRLSRLVLGALMLNLSIVGQTLPCAHEHVVGDQTATSVEAGLSSHSGHEPSNEPEPCDDAEATCCEAIASCSISAVPSVGSSAGSNDTPSMSAFAGVSLRPHGLLLEVATPPPRA